MPLALHDRLPTQLIHLRRATFSDHLPIDIPGDDLIRKGPGRSSDLHLVPKAEHTRIPHRDLSPQRKILVLLPADVAIDRSHSPGQYTLVQFLQVRQGKLLKLLGRDQAIALSRSRRSGQDATLAKGIHKVLNHLQDMIRHQPQSPVGGLRIQGQPHHELLHAT